MGVQDKKKRKERRELLAASDQEPSLALFEAKEPVIMGVMSPRWVGGFDAGS